jgi:hypothetical protein
MTSQERQALITGWMRERMEQGYTALEAHSYALHQLGMLENCQAEAERENRRQAARKLEEARKNQP